jgi:putative copper resistance protein D
MIEVLGLGVRLAYAGASAVLFGLLMFLYGSSAGPLAAWRTRWLRVGLAIGVLALLSGLAVLADQARSVSGSVPRLATVATLVTDSRFGAVWTARQGLLLLALACTATAVKMRMPRAALVPAAAAAALALAVAPLSGHSAAEEPAWPALSVHAVHVVAASAWLGALPALLSLLRLASEHPDTAPAVLSRFIAFSRLALPLMLGILGTGVTLAAIHVERWPPLLGTAYGYLLLGKVMCITAVLALAARLRRRLRSGPETSRAAGGLAGWLAAETCLGFAVLALAATLAQTIPARHDDVAWHLPFRLSLDAAGETPGMLQTALAAGSLAVVLVLAAAALSRAHRPHAALAAVTSLAAAGTALWALAVDAYPDTYRRPTVPYQAVSISNGATLFQAHCAACHGRSGRGDGPLAERLAARPADLTEPHTALHTAGDIFWWLTHGKPPGAMPGFADRLAEDDRWDLINYLRTLSAGYQGRIIEPRVVPRAPWLGAIDFDFVDRDGHGGSLKDFRERSVVLLVFFSDSDASRARLAELAAVQARLEGAGAQILAVPTSGTQGAGAPGRVVLEGGDATVAAYSLLRRTLRDADAHDERPVPGHMELLVDRYGYVRARWLPGEDEAWRDPDFLLPQVRALGAEGRLRDPPDDHVH